MPGKNADPLFFFHSPGRPRVAGALRGLSQSALMSIFEKRSRGLLAAVKRSCGLVQLLQLLLDFSSKQPT